VRPSPGWTWGLGILALLGLAALAAPLYPLDPNGMNLDSRLSRPGHGHWLGTDALGRDVASRVLHGGRVSLAVGLLATALALAVGLPLGLAAGHLGGWVDAGISRAIEAALCFPSLILALALIAASPAWLRDLPETLRVALVIALSGWIPIARFARAETLRLGRSDMALAARALGAGHLRIVLRYLLPSAAAPVLVTASFAVGAAIGLEAALSFLGLGVQLPRASWGGMLSEARRNAVWWLALFPGAALFATVLACNLVGEGLRDRLDPRSARRPAAGPVLSR
jgi:peptide/nickel transport system permease protein